MKTLKQLAAAVILTGLLVAIVPMPQARADNPVDSPYGEFAGTSHNASATIAAVDSRKLYLTDLTVVSDAAATIEITSNSVSLFKFTTASAGGYEKAWRRGLPSSSGNSLVITVSAGNYDINYNAVAK